MDWQERTDGAGAVEWERDDRFARVVLRETAGGGWAVTLDVLEQAPEGPGYARETFETRAAAEERAAEWRVAHDGESESQ